MSSLQTKLVRSFWIAVALLFAADIVLIIKYTPDEESMGAIQKIFYLHLPVAINTFLACLTAFVASIAYLWQRKAWWDDLAAAAARVAVQLCAVVLATGMIWGRAAWGVWWTWSPRLTFSLILFLLYVVYLVVRSSVEGRDSPRRHRLGLRDHRFPRRSAGLVVRSIAAGYSPRLRPTGTGHAADFGGIVRAGDAPRGRSDRHPICS